MAIIASVIVLVAFSFQYPAVMPSPIGGDAAIHVRRTMDGTMGSVYPLSMALFSAGARIIPASWETSFVVWMALGHVATGLAIGLILYRIGGKWPAVFGMLFWSAATMNVLPFFRAATMPQLWSMVFLLLTIERFIKGSVWWGALALVATYFAHPVSFAVGALVAALALPTLFTFRWLPDVFPRRTIALGITLLSGGAVLMIFLLFPSTFPFADLAWDEPWHNMLRLLSTHFGPVLLLAPVGAVIFAVQRRTPLPSRLVLLVFGTLSVMLSLNDTFGGDIPVKRFIPYGIATAAIFGALGMYHLVSGISPHRWAKGVLTALMLAILLTNGWNIAQSAYQEFASGCTVPYTCPAVRHAEREAYEWIHANLPEDAVMVVAEGRGRATEWIPVLAERNVAAPRFSGQWADTLLTGSCADMFAIIARDKQTATHAVLYKTGDIIPQLFTDYPNLFSTIYENEDVIIIAFPNKEDVKQREELCE